MDKVPGEDVVPPDPAEVQANREEPAEGTAQQEPTNPNIPANPLECTMTLQGFFICLREFFGTAIYTYVGCMAYLDSLSQGLIYTVLQASAEISSSGGLHLNPVITLGAFIAGKIKNPLLVISMMFFQLLGCLLGAGFYRGSQTKEQFLYFRTRYDPRYVYRRFYAGVSEVEDTGELFQYCGAEMVLTCILVTVFLRLFPLATASLPTNKKELREAEDRKYVQAIVVGLTIAILNGQLMGSDQSVFIGVMNPFRALGPMALWVSELNEDVKKRVQREVVKEMWKGHWIYWVGPVLGGVLAGVVDRIIVSSKRRDILTLQPLTDD